MMLELDVLPEHGLACDSLEFTIGMHFSQAVACISQHVGQIKDVQIIYSESDPLTSDLIICLSADGLKLIFDSIYQRLKVIEIFDLSSIRLRYCDVLFNCPEVCPTIDQIDQCFGATHPGVYDESKNVFTLTFRGLAFQFPADAHFKELLKGKRDVEATNILLSDLQLSSETTGPGPGSNNKRRLKQPRVSKMYIYHSGSNFQQAHYFNEKSSETASRRQMWPSHYDEGNVEILTRDREDKSPSDDPSHRKHACIYGIRVSASTTGQKNQPPPPPQEGFEPLGSSTGTSSPVHSSDISFGDCVQDVLSAVGGPGQIFYKSDDKMKIHASNAHRALAEKKSDYFYNYFHLGFDILFDATSNTVKKFVIHTNYPGHYNFNMYRRCQFKLRWSGTPKAPKSSSASGDVSLRNKQKGGCYSKGKKGVISSSSIENSISNNNDMEYMDGFVIDPFKKWSEIKKHVVSKDSVCRPVVINRASTTNTINPFGPTFCYGGFTSGGSDSDLHKTSPTSSNPFIENIIFEVMQNDHLASLVAYAPPQNSSYSDLVPAHSLGSVGSVGRFHLEDGRLVPP